MIIAGFTISPLPPNNIIQKSSSCVCKVVIASKASILGKQKYFHGLRNLNIEKKEEFSCVFCCF